MLEVFFFNWYINTIKAFKEFKSTHDLSIPSQTMQLSMCLCISAIKILRSPETQGEGPRLSLSRAHMPVQQTHTQSRSLQQKEEARLLYTQSERKL